MNRHHHRLVPWQRRVLYVSGVSLILTGVFWLTVHYTVGAGVGELPHPSEAWLMRFHGMAMFAWLFSQGALAAAHVPQGWRLTGRHRWAGQRNSGVVLCVASGLLALTGYLLYYFAPESIRPGLGWIHTIVGLAMAALLVTHRRRTSLRATPQPALPPDRL